MKTIRTISILVAVCLILPSCSTDTDTNITLDEPVEVRHDTAIATRMDLAKRNQYEAYVKAEIEQVSFEKGSGKLKEIYVSFYFVKF